MAEEGPAGPRVAAPPLPHYPGARHSRSTIIGRADYRGFAGYAAWISGTGTEAPANAGAGDEHEEQQAGPHGAQHGTSHGPHPPRQHP